MPDRSPTDPIVIDCSTCLLEHSAACDDCVVTFICSREPNDAVVIDLEELRAMRVLGDAGLVPPLRLSERP